ncbi:unnamed protein product [Thelazia callipaeda]|uniref:Palmitoyltransferase n=1 Tax=Thelazia callipaeda TaxID=103827 RepID=A0A0N5D5M7_THECL|nr:unnamed protein product [Thelazia callipaeda]
MRGYVLDFLKGFLVQDIVLLVGLVVLLMRYHLFLWVLSFILWYILFSAAYCAHIFPYGSATLVAELIIFQVIWIMAVFSLFGTVLTTPADIPRSFVPPVLIFEKPNVAEEIAKWAREKKLPVRYIALSANHGTIKCPPFCVRCRVIKPNRTHHCRKCNRCIIRMDHHCPIIGRCIHMHNHKFFLLFLFWAAVLCFYAVLTTAPALFRRTPVVIWSFTGMVPSFVPGFSRRPPPPTDGLVATCLVASGALNALICGISLGIFSFQLGNSLLSNETTLESTSFQLCGGSDRRNPTDGITYDLGSKLANFRSIFGNNPYLWLLPVHSTYGDGLFKEFQLKNDLKRKY